MGSRVGLGKARHVAVTYLWLQQLVADKTIKLVKVNGTQHPPDVGTKYLSKQGMLRAKSMGGLMEPESLMPFGYKVEDSAGVRDKLVAIADMRSSMVASIGIASLFRGQELNRLAASFISIIAAGTAPMRAAATVTSQELTITTTSSYFNSEITVRLIGSILLVSITTIDYSDCNVYWHELASAAEEAADV
eukprot:3003792-Amphidinium_carterae.2